MVKHYGSLFLISIIDIAMQIPALLLGLQENPLTLHILFFKVKFCNNQEHIFFVYKIVFSIYS